MAVTRTSKNGVKATMPFKMPKPVQPQAVKRSRDEIDDDDDDDEDDSEPEEEETGSSTIDGDEVLDDSESDEDSSEEDDGSAEEEDEDDEAIRELGQKPKPAKKTKNVSLKPTTADDFASQLQHLLSLPATSAVPKPKVAAPSDRQLKLERQARRLVRDTKAAKLARGHVRDVIGGWGPRPALPFSQWDNAAARRFAHAQTNGASEGVVSGGAEAAAAAETSAEREKRLRKLAQRGVVRLFNAIAAAQGAAQEEKTVERSPKKQKRTSAAGEDGTTAEEPKTLRRPNVLGGKGRDQAIANLSKASFLDLIRAGTK